MPSFMQKLASSGISLDQHNVDQMAAGKIMKGMGATVKDIGKLCARFGIEYIEDDTPLQRAVKLMREVYDGMKFVSFVSASTGTVASIYSDLLDDSRTGIMFFRPKGSDTMTAFVKGKGLMGSPLGQIVIKPGIAYRANRDGVELWEQNPVALVRSFSAAGSRL